MTGIRGLALTIRFVLELAAIGVVGWWGFALDSPAVVRVIAGLAAPLVVIVVWGVVVSPRARFGNPGWRREIVEALVWLTAVGTLVEMGHPVLAGLFALLVLADRIALRIAAGVLSRLETTEQGTARPAA